MGTIYGARRSWIFLPGASGDQLESASRSGVDVAIQDLEDFTPLELKGDARKLTAEVCATWRQAGVEPAVRVTPMDEAGMEDTETAVAAGASIVVLAKAEDADQIRRLDVAIAYFEGKYGHPRGAIEIAPTIESPGALLRLQQIATASARISSAILSSEDLANNLGVGRTIRSTELDYARSSFVFECAAAGVLAVDCPFTFDDGDAAIRDLERALELGYRAKSLVDEAHVHLINSRLGSSEADLRSAAGLVAAFEAAQRDGRAQVTFERRIVELPAYTAAKRLLTGAPPNR
jgi:citrate lyase subunit beta/citryl-CoA lyase